MLTVISAHRPIFRIHVRIVMPSAVHSLVMLERNNVFADNNVVNERTSNVTLVDCAPDKAEPLHNIFICMSDVTLFTEWYNSGIFCFRSVVGVFTADNVRRRLANLSGSLSEALEKFTIKKFYKVDLTHKPTLGLISRMLDIAPYVVVIKSGKYKLPLFLQRYCDNNTHYFHTGCESLTSSDVTRFYLSFTLRLF